MGVACCKEEAIDFTGESKYACGEGAIAFEICKMTVAQGKKEKTDQISKHSVWLRHQLKPSVHAHLLFVVCCRLIVFPFCAPHHAHWQLSRSPFI